VANSTSRPSRTKARPSFPLWLHAGTGQWAKKIKRRVYYFGIDQDAALVEYLRVKEDLEAGRTPREVQPDSVTITHLCNSFLTDAKARRDSEEIAPRTFTDYYKTCELILDRLGKTTAVDQLRPDDLMTLRRWLSKKRSAVGLGNDIGRIRVVLNYAFQSGLIDRPVRFGDFKRPAKRVLRRQRAAAGPKLFEADEIRTLLDHANPSMRAMILLGINCGLGNNDCAKLEFRHLDLKRNRLDFPRPKTGIERKSPLWPETVDALQTWIAARKDPASEDHKSLVFITKYRGPWAIDTSTRNPLSAEFRKLLQASDVMREGLSFYILRHTFQTIADEVGDYLSTKRIMGHIDPSISATYRERFAFDRLVRVTDHVHGWLFGEGTNDD